MFAAWKRWRSRRKLPAPRPFRYERFAIGRRLPPAYYGRPYVIVNPGYYRLPPAYGAQRWVRHYDDVLLIDIRTGIVRDIIRGFYW